MRPRVFPAEDARTRPRVARTMPSFNEAAGIPRGRRKVKLPDDTLSEVASMRPRVFPAEDPRDGDARRGRRHDASMRPGVFPAEDVLRAPTRAVDGHASMRPRVFPAEDKKGRIVAAILDGKLQ